MMTGGGSCYNGANRWFDKTVQLVVSEDGSSGLCYEHSCSEGIVVISLLETIIGRAADDPSVMFSQSRRRPLLGPSSG